MRALVVALFALALTACGGEPDPAPTNDAVLERIAGLDDCAALQQEFDTADANGSTAYMEAADERMREVGCY